LPYTLSLHYIDYADILYVNYLIFWCSLANFTRT